MDSWALVSSALFCVYRPHPRPVGHPLSINGDGEWTPAARALLIWRWGKTPAAAGVMDCARGRSNREVEIGKLRVEI